MRLTVKKNKILFAGFILFAVLAAAAVLIPFCSPWTITEMHAEIRNAPASFAHPFGTDKFGRDLFVRVWYGARISLFIGIASAGLNGAVGIIYGGIAGYAGKYVDIVLMRAADILASIPSLLYVILITLVFGTDETGILLGLCVSGWIETARIVRGEVMRIKEQEYCIAAKLLGTGRLKTFFRHILPNAAGPVVVSLTFLIPQAIFTEAFLSFAGIGIPAPAASLGTLIQSSVSQIWVYPSQMLCPVIVLCLLITSVNLIGAGMEKQMKNSRKETL